MGAFDDVVAGLKIVSDAKKAKSDRLKEASNIYYELGDQAPPEILETLGKKPAGLKDVVDSGAHHDKGNASAEHTSAKSTDTDISNNPLQQVVAMSPKKKNELGKLAEQYNAMSVMADKGVVFKPNYETGKLESSKDPQYAADAANKKTMEAEKESVALQIQKKKLAQESKEASGKTVPAGEAVSTGGATAATQALTDVSGLVTSNENVFGPGAGRVAGLQAAIQMGEGGKKAASVNAVLKQRAQIIGKYLEGGKLTDSDIARYEKSLPQLTDSPEVAQDKVASLNRLIVQKQQAEQAALKGAGYNTDGIPIQKDLTKLPGSGKPAPKGISTVQQGGHTYTWNPNTGKYE